MHSFVTEYTAKWLVCNFLLRQPGIRAHHLFFRALERDRLHASEVFEAYVSLQRIIKK